MALRRAYSLRLFVGVLLLRNVHEITSTTFSQDSDNKGIANS
jgi:hypothetical protein